MKARNKPRPKRRSTPLDHDPMATAMDGAAAAIKAYLATPLARECLTSDLEREALFRLVMLRFDASDNADACRRVGVILSLLREGESVIANAFEHALHGEGRS